jgi:hypothetical protein
MGRREAFVMVWVYGGTDPVLELFIDRLTPYLRAHPDAVGEIYRDAEYHAVRVRVIDPRFRSMSGAERHAAVWSLFKSMDVEPLNDLFSVVTVTPEEVRKLGSSLKFNDLMPPVRQFFTERTPAPRPVPAAARTKKPKG